MKRKRRVDKGFVGESANATLKDPFVWRREERRVKESRVELAKNMLILS